MDLKIMSRNELKNFLPEKNKKYLIFSFYEENDYPKITKNLSEQTVFHYFLQVDDVAYVNEDICKKYKIFKEYHAKKVLEVLKEYSNNADCIITQCEAGISRSSGLMIGICRYLNISEDWIYQDFRFLPNQRIVDVFSDILQKERKIAV